jgi:hypothetical protein
MQPEQSALEREVAAFEDGSTDLATFDHEAHVRVAFVLLQRHPFLDALKRIGDGLQRLAFRSGTPERFHVTVTVAFVSAVAEQAARHQTTNWFSFRATCPELLDRTHLATYYTTFELNDPIARTVFVLPSGRERAGTTLVSEK